MAKLDLNHILKAVGLTDKESALYLAGLHLGSAPASEYAQHSDVNRITAYNTLESLLQRGLFTAVKRNRGRWYAPVAPEYLALEARKNAEALDRALPELRSLQGASHRKPRVRFYKGWEGVRKVYEDTLSAEGEILNFANSATVRNFWERYDEEYVAERVKRGISLRGIAPDDKAGREAHGKDQDTLREIRLVPSKEFDFENEVNIYDNKVAIISFSKDPEELFGVIIESVEVAKTQKQIFQMAWRYAEGLTK